MAITITPSTPGFHVIDAQGNIIHTEAVRGDAILAALATRADESSSIRQPGEGIGVVNAAGALVWGNRPADPSAPKAPKAAPKAKAPRKPSTRPAAPGNPTPGANGCSLKRLKVWAAKFGAEVATGADAVVVTVLEGTWNAGVEAGESNGAHITVRFSDHENARAAYGAALAYVKQGVSA